MATKQIEVVMCRIHQREVEKLGSYKISQQVKTPEPEHLAQTGLS